VKVLSVDRERERIALSFKQMRPNPWDQVEERYHPGDLVRGIVSHVTSFGAFVLLEEELEGLVHISEMPDTQRLHPQYAVLEGEWVTVRVLHVDGSEKRLSLSLRQPSPESE
jgi:ribosomal protein S1